MQEKIIILDFGSQTTQLIGRRVRELDTYCEIVPYNKFPKEDPTIDLSISFFGYYLCYKPMGRLFHSKFDSRVRSQLYS